MTLDTRIYILDEVDPEEVFRLVQGFVGAYDYPPRTPEQQVSRCEPRATGGMWGRDNVLGQDLPAWLMTTFRPDGPLWTAEQAAECSDDCEPGGNEDGTDYHYHSHACWMEISLDTAYSYRDHRHWDCNILHAAIMVDLGKWLHERGIRWEWKNEYTGDIYLGFDGMDSLFEAGEEAQNWFHNIVLPAIKNGIGME